MFCLNGSLCLIRQGREVSTRMKKLNECIIKLLHPHITLDRIDETNYQNITFFLSFFTDYINSSIHVAKRMSIECKPDVKLQVRIESNKVNQLKDWSTLWGMSFKFLTWALTPERIQQQSQCSGLRGQCLQIPLCQVDEVHTLERISYHHVVQMDDFPLGRHFQD